MSKKKKKNSDTREFTAVKTTDCQNKCDNKNDTSKQQETMRMSDRAPKPSFEV